MFVFVEDIEKWGNDKGWGVFCLLVLLSEKNKNVMICFFIFKKVLEVEI